MSTVSRLAHLSIVTALVAVAAVPMAQPSPASAERGERAVTNCAPIMRTGTYRVLLRRERAEPIPGQLVLERAAGCLSGLFVTEQSSAPLDSLVISETELSGVMLTQSGAAKISLKFTPTGVTGTVAQGKKVWSVEGERTS